MKCKVAWDGRTMLGHAFRDASRLSTGNVEERILSLSLKADAPLANFAHD
jgi:hypothetical protein